MKRLLVLSLLATSLAVAPLGLAAQHTATGTTTVKVVAKEFKFTLTPKTAKAGTVVFKVVNKGHVMHDFKIAGKKTSMLKPGKSATLKVKLKKGSYKYLCTVPGHAAAGMKGTFKVK
jgi:uncharacterized cupredoxin-like copper-binding protein